MVYSKRDDYKEPNRFQANFHPTFNTSTAEIRAAKRRKQLTITTKQRKKIVEITLKQSQDYLSTQTWPEIQCLQE